MAVYKDAKKGTWYALWDMISMSLAMVPGHAGAAPHAGRFRSAVFRSS